MFKVKTKSHAMEWKNMLKNACLQIKQIFSRKEKLYLLKEQLRFDFLFTSS
jgi:hypothetical protein